MNWIEEKIADALFYAAPKGFEINNKALRPILKRLMKTDGVCPCAHEEWDDNTPMCDKICPCKTFRDSGECHCGLYVKLQK